jgi:sulfur-oxidizing protein SoxX
MKIVIGGKAMRKTAKFATTGVSLAALFAGASMMPMAAGAADAETIKMGKEVAYDRKKGNCLACHMMGDGVSPGDIGPPLVAMQARYPSKEALAKQIYDPTVKNPDVVMPPFGKHEILTEQEFADFVEYIWSL